MVQIHILWIIGGGMLLSGLMFFLGLVLSMGKTADLEEELDRKDKALNEIEAELNNLKLEDNGKKELLDEMNGIKNNGLKVKLDDPEKNLGYMEAGL